MFWPIATSDESRQLQPSQANPRMLETGHFRVGPMTPQDAIAAELKELEELLLLPDVRKSARLVDLLADDFIEFGSSGRVYAKQDLVAVLQAESPTAQTTSGFKVTSLAPDVALLTYRIRRHSQPTVDTLRSSIWRRSNGNWQMVFHQGTVTSMS